MNTSWLQGLQQLQRGGDAYVLATVVAVSGSTPRDSASKMVIAAGQRFDTIGGGHLEYQVIAKAEQMLAQQSSANATCSCCRLEHFQLASQLGQCCGGTVTVLLEYFPASQVNIMLFGAGHVAKALVSILSQLPCRVTWVDSRAQEFPAQYLSDDYQGNVKVCVSEQPVVEISQMAANGYYLVMTHNHQLDFELCHKILQRGDFSYLGLIASNTKWRRFQQRFKHREIADALVARISSPVGLAAVPGKQPMEVAVSIAAELIGLYQRGTAQANEANLKGKKAQGLPWSDIKSLLQHSDVQVK